MILVRFYFLFFRNKIHVKRRQIDIRTEYTRVSKEILYLSRPKTARAYNRDFTVYEKIFCVNAKLFVRREINGFYYKTIMIYVP